ncbi:histone chaperone domain CHZ-domain-containing protein [Aspergillus avenaceus]|uniref:Histone chaperone domain CHZ-domain-containing protein n=1 Tax=Aspergillus avenaceus TaxID=36643 RepID=A0A5N6TGW7_ASPAV|nr:histone chaperone domain CHZ-domain-containing protein [Aspergillus avenaceus]
MGDNNQATTPLSNNLAANASDAAAIDKGKGKATNEPTAMDVSMDEDESEESENEDMMEEDDEDDEDNLEPISEDNIISGGRRTRGKTIDFQDAATKIRDEGDDDDDDEDFRPNDTNVRD